MEYGPLLIVPRNKKSSAAWLSRVAGLLKGYRCFPQVLRHHILQGPGHYKADVEVRRWSEDRYLRLTDGKKEQHWWLDEQGRIWLSQLQRRRWLRQHTHEQIFDEVFAVLPVNPIPGDVLERVLERLLTQHGMSIWLQWNSLNSQQKQLLVRTQHSWEVLQPALEHSTGVALEALPMILGAEAHPATRLALLEAGSQGIYAPPAEILPWLLLQVEWNVSPGLLGLARSCLQRFTAQALRLKLHPNPTVRRRLAQLLPDRQPWLDWLSSEADEDVRQALRLRIESETPIRQVIDQLLLETDPRRRGALGWLLAHWSRPLDEMAGQRRLWRSVEAALSPSHRALFQTRNPLRRG